MSVLEAVEHLVGLQAQAPFSPYFQLWSRLAQFTADGLAQLLLDRQAVRIAVMRGTIHLVSATDCLTLRPLTQVIMDREVHTNASRAKALVGVDLDELGAVARLVLKDQPRTNAELGSALAQHWPGRDGRHLAYAARAVLPLVQVPPRAIWGRSGQTRVTTAQLWLGRKLDPAPALADLVLRYLRALGPASVADIQTWSGLTRLREVVDQLRPQLISLRNDKNAELFDLPDAPRPDPSIPAPPRFLPDYDNLIRSHADRTRVIADVDRARIATRNGVVPHVLLVDGFVSGVWRIAREKNNARLSVTLFRRLTAAERDPVTDEGHRLLGFTEPDADAYDIVLTS
jgi:hypothetical protein